MIRTVRIRGFKRFDEVEFRLPGHVVLAGPNNTGKTTLLQAIASWSLALWRWRELNDFRLRRGLAYGRAPIARQAFSAVPLWSFDLLWMDRRYRGQIEIRHEVMRNLLVEANRDERAYAKQRHDGRIVVAPTTFGGVDPNRHPVELMVDAGLMEWLPSKRGREPQVARVTAKGRGIKLGPPEWSKVASYVEQGMGVFGALSKLLGGSDV